MTTHPLCQGRDCRHEGDDMSRHDGDWKALEGGTQMTNLKPEDYRAALDKLNTGFFSTMDLNPPHYTYILSCGEETSVIKIIKYLLTRAALSGDSVVDTQYGKIIDEQEKTIALLRNRIIELSTVDTQKIDYTVCIKCNNPQPYLDLVNTHCRYCEDAASSESAMVGKVSKALADVYENNTTRHLFWNLRIEMAEAAIAAMRGTI